MAAVVAHGVGPVAPRRRAPAIARLEAGNVSPSLPTLERVADALHAELTVSLVGSRSSKGKSP
jgi:transcriptional regulator with XRE-family HTH domain